MLKYCVEKWFENRDKLELAIRQDDKVRNCNYYYLLQLVVEQILNPGAEEYNRFDSNAITVADNGNYAGTQLFLIPRETYEPGAGDYLLTFMEYGSCPLCDVLEMVQMDIGAELTDAQLADFMLICKDLVCNMLKPYNFGWREEELFVEQVAKWEEVE